MDSKRFKLAEKKDIPPGHSLIIDLPNGCQIALFNVEGKIYALDNTCPHMGGPLGEGKIEKGCVTCPWHAWTFDIKTGLCINVPGDDATSIPIEVHDEEIYLIEEHS